MFSGGIEMEQWAKMSSAQIYKIKYLSLLFL